MIIYDLICDVGHSFEGWFSDAADLEHQKDTGLLLCPICDSSDISKKLAAPNIGKKSNSMAVAPAPVQQKQNVAVGGGDSPEKFAQLQKMLGQVHNYIENNFEDVGNKFSDEAISIHRGEKDAVNIRGTASAEQIKEMVEEGVEAVALPPKPIDRKKIN